MTRPSRVFACPARQTQEIQVQPECILTSAPKNSTINVDRLSGVPVSPLRPCCYSIESLYTASVQDGPSVRCTSIFQPLTGLSPISMLHHKKRNRTGRPHVASRETIRATGAHPSGCQPPRESSPSGRACVHARVFPVFDAQTLPVCLDEMPVSIHLPDTPVLAPCAPALAGKPCPQDAPPRGEAYSLWPQGPDSAEIQRCRAGFFPARLSSCSRIHTFSCTNILETIT